MADEPTKIFLEGTVTTIVDHKITPQPYGGYIVPGSTLENISRPAVRGRKASERTDE